MSPLLQTTTTLSRIRNRSSFLFTTNYSISWADTVHLGFRSHVCLILTFSYLGSSPHITVCSTEILRWRWRRFVFHFGLFPFVAAAVAGIDIYIYMYIHMKCRESGDEGNVSVGINEKIWFLDYYLVENSNRSDLTYEKKMVEQSRNVIAAALFRNFCFIFDDSNSIAATTN